MNVNDMLLVGIRKGIGSSSGASSAAIACSACSPWALPCYCLSDVDHHTNDRDLTRASIVTPTYIQFYYVLLKVIGYKSLHLPTSMVIMLV